MALRLRALVTLLVLAVSLPNALAAPARPVDGFSFYVMLPADGRYGARTYAGSGTTTAQAAVRALSAHVTKVIQAPLTQDLDDVLQARQENLTHVFQATILNWEDRATEWSEKRDRLSLKFSVYDVETGALIDSATVESRSRWFTFGGDHPQDLLPVPTQQFVDQIFVRLSNQGKSRSVSLQSRPVPFPPRSSTANSVQEKTPEQKITNSSAPPMLASATVSDAPNKSTLVKPNLRVRGGTVTVLGEDIGELHGQHLRALQMRWGGAVPGGSVG